ncbi:MAG: DNA polymerase [Hyphomicrobiaceae bacterium]
MTRPLHTFAEIWLVVWSADAIAGACLAPRAVVASMPGATPVVVEFPTDGTKAARRPPYSTSAKALLVTIDAQVLVGCHLALGWPVPARTIDLLIEFRVSSNGQRRSSAPRLRGALRWLGQSSASERGTAVDMLERRLAALEQLWTVMAPSLDLGRALLRGRYLAAVARIERTGVPIDVNLVSRMRTAWHDVRQRVAREIDDGFGVLRDGRLQVDAFEAWLNHRAIAWPRLQSGRLDLTDGVLRDMTRAHPELRPLRQLLSLLTAFDPGTLAIGADGRNRTPLRPFASRTGRNQPSAKASVLAQSAWARHLVRPSPGMGLALIDWKQQEFGIAAALSGAERMQAAYSSGDPYLALAIQAGAAPKEATPDTHSDVRARFKTCALGMQYGMGRSTLARLIDGSEAAADALVRAHKAAFPKFWRWSDGIEADALLNGHLTSVFGWRVAVGPDANPRFLRNFPLQANGAEMLRLACCTTTEAGIRVCMPMHDALLIEAPIEDLDATIATTQDHMAEASRIVLDGFALATEVKVVRHPDRLSDDRGTVVWRAVQRALDEPADERTASPAHERHGSCAPAHPRIISLYVSKKERGDDTDPG